MELGYILPWNCPLLESILYPLVPLGDFSTIICTVDEFVVFAQAERVMAVVMSKLVPLPQST